MDGGKSLLGGCRCWKEFRGSGSRGGSGIDDLSGLAWSQLNHLGGGWRMPDGLEGLSGFGLMVGDGSWRRIRSYLRIGFQVDGSERQVWGVEACKGNSTVHWL